MMMIMMMTVDHYTRIEYIHGRHFTIARDDRLK